MRIKDELRIIVAALQQQLNVGSVDAALELFESKTGEKIDSHKTIWNGNEYLYKGKASATTTTTKIPFSS